MYTNKSQHKQFQGKPCVYENKQLRTPTCLNDYWEVMLRTNSHSQNHIWWQKYDCHSYFGVLDRYVFCTCRGLCNMSQLLFPTLVCHEYVFKCKLQATIGSAMYPVLRVLLCVEVYVNSLLPSDVNWIHWPWSILAHVMTDCLTAATDSRGTRGNAFSSIFN